jgi:hypothetical protein
MDMKTIGRKTTKKVSAEKSEELISKLRKEHEKMVKGKFEFLDAQGGWLEFSYRFFPDDVLINYKFYHGEICEIPMGLVKHLNNTVKKVRKIGADTGADRGNELPSHGKVPMSYEYISRVRFTPLEMF